MPINPDCHARIVNGAPWLTVLADEIEMSFDEIAVIANVPVAKLHAIATDDDILEHYELERVAAALGVTVDDIADCQ
ncbi:hypothetical protein [Sphingomonas sp. LaA6.9]|uniref:hypothetical protein n=1 Tax=Sphingomonas sp. LaA6.9 TaxID=2919914 RepID=UPI001F4F18CA|nr:hypothetical protein [Sphingomonas sp. LaA6.9]MCJ8157247.1 hypothetical protein [Sphingomonas sp. LaA6.9]